MKTIKLQIINGINYVKLYKVVPKCYKNIVSALSEKEIYDIAIFPNEKVILSGNAKKAIVRMEPATINKQIAIGYCFTKEAKLLFEENGIEFIQIHEFHWTDESYTDIVQGI